MKNTIILSLSLLSSVFLSAQSVDLSQGLIGAYTFNLGPDSVTASLSDTSGLNTDLAYTAVAAAAYDRKGVKGALELGQTFSPNQKKFLSHTPGIPFPGGASERSFSLWFRKDTFDFNFEAAIQFIFFYGFPTLNNGCGIALDYTAKQIYFAGVQNDLIVSYPLQFKEWYHLAATYNGQQAKLYLNGSLLDSQNITGWQTNTTSSSARPRFGYLSSAIPTGGSQVNYYNVYHGLIDDILIYDRVLNAAEAYLLAHPDSTGSGVGLGSREMAGLEIFPNPVSDKLWIRNAHQGSDFSITDLSGRLYWQAKQMSHSRIDTEYLKPGMYALTYYRDGRPYVRKFLKQ